MDTLVLKMVPPNIKIQKLILFGFLSYSIAGI